MTEDELSERFRRVLTHRVGGFFSNTLRVAGETCEVCTSPSGMPICENCSKARYEFGSRLADLALTLAYARGYAPNGPHQSAHTVRAYKRTPPAEKCARDMNLMVAAATFLHDKCIAKAIGSSWEAITFVPSASKPGPEHPVAELARMVFGAGSAEKRLRLELGPGFSDPNRVVRADRFIVPDPYRDRVAGRHVLLVEDTWVTGAKVQSAAVALHDAGARAVTILCVARWCRYDWMSHKEFLDAHAAPYDAYLCPVTGGSCP